MIDLYLMKRPFLWIPLFAVAAFSFACDSAGEVSSALDPGTFETTITGSVETELMGTAIVTIDAFGGEPELFLKFQTPSFDAILLSKESLEPLGPRSYSVGLGDPESFSGFVSLADHGGPPALFVNSGTITVTETSATAAVGSFELDADVLGNDPSIHVEGVFSALVP